MNKKMKSLDMSFLRDKKAVTISTKESLSDVSLLEWSDGVQSPKKKVVMHKRQAGNLMCSVGDIIVIQQYRDGNAELHRHSFVVLNNEGGQIQGLDYDICNVMSSFKSPEQRLKKLSFPGNLEYRNEYSDIRNGVWYNEQNVNKVWCAKQSLAILAGENPEGERNS